MTSMREPEDRARRPQGVSRKRVSHRAYPSKMPRDITTICAHPDTWAAHGVFNPNEWRSKSKAIVRSCSAQLGLLLHMTSEAAHALERGEAVCKLRLQELQKQWRTHPWRLDRSQYLVEVPTVHVLVQAYLSFSKDAPRFPGPVDYHGGRGRESRTWVSQEGRRSRRRVAWHSEDKSRAGPA